MSEDRTKVRLLRIMRALIERPKYYTKKHLAALYSVDPDTISNDFEALRSADFNLKADEKYRYYFAEEKPYSHLKNLLLFSDKDLQILYQAIDKIGVYDESGQRLKRKLASLYDYHQLGHAYLRRPYLTVVDLLMQGKNERRQVILREYRSSNSNEVRDRLVEPFHPSPPDDTLQAFDVEKRKLRHFRISRITRVQLTNTPWQYEGHHNILLTDVFRIVDSNQVMVHLRIKEGARNELIERFPNTVTYIKEAPEEGIYDFQCMVNHKFLGLSNFILGYYHQLVEVLSPESLIEHLREEVKKMKF